MEAPVIGLVTSQLTYLNTGDDVSTNFTYDSFGNVLTVTDANGNTINYSYDSTNTFVTKVVDAKNKREVWLCNFNRYLSLRWGMWKSTNGC